MSGLQIIDEVWKNWVKKGQKGTFSGSEWRDKVNFLNHNVEETNLSMKTIHTCCIPMLYECFPNMRPILTYVPLYAHTIQDYITHL